MKRIFYYTAMFLFGSLFFSCEDVVQIKLDEGAKKYVIDAFVNDLRAKQTVRVLLSDSYFSTNDPPPVTNASVVLKDLSENKQYNFTYEANGNYVYEINNLDTIAKIGHKYELNVTIDGVMYASFATQNRKAAADSIRAELINRNFGPPNPSGDPLFRCILHARDKVDATTDYYWVKTYRNDSLMFEPQDINVCVDGTGTGQPLHVEGVDTIEFTPPSTLLSFKLFRPGNLCKVEIHSISRDAFNFFVQAGTQLNNGGLFATTPENVKTNIITPDGAKLKAAGWFNMASVSTRTKVVK